MMKKQSSISTAGSNRDHAFPSAAATKQTPAPEKESADEEKIGGSSPIRWGFLAAAITHVANIFAAGLTAGHPWGCVHGVLNMVLASVLFYIVTFWNSHYHVDLNVRNELLRFSGAVSLAMLGLMVGHLTLTVAYYTGDSNPYGEINFMFAGTPVFYGLLWLLWTAFSYIQYVAIRNLARTTAPETVSLDQEIQNSVARGDHRRELVKGCQQNQATLWFYLATLIPAQCLYACGFVYMKVQTLMSSAALCSGTLLFCAVVSYGVRSNRIAIMAQSVLTIPVVIEIFTSAFRSGSSGWASALLILSLQIVGLISTTLRYQKMRETDRTKHEQAPEHFFRTNPKPMPSTSQDPMSYFMAGVAHKEDEMSVMV